MPQHLTDPTHFREKARQKIDFDLVHTVHAAEVEQLKPVEPAHRFQVTLEPDTFTDEKYQLYKNYQIHVHHDEPKDVAPSGFRRFLCESPLERTKRTKNGVEQALGSFHQCYRLDGRLVAIGVLDLLPHGVSGVYFIYHQDFEKWSFGKLSAMREAAMAIEKGYEFYYMGFYIHNCAKMRYKGDYKPQYVLDPISHTWSPLDEEMRSLLDKDKFVSRSMISKLREITTTTDTSERLETMADVDTPDPNTFRGPDEEIWSYRLPANAAESGESLLKIRMPGVMTAEEVLEYVDLDDMNISLGARKTYKTEVSLDPMCYIGHRSNTDSSCSNLCLGPKRRTSHSRIV